MPVILEQAQGKAAALNQAVRHASGELLFFQDARQQVDSEALRELAACFADPSVGAASGELLLESAADTPDSLGLYWTIEKAVRKLEAASGSVVGVTGAIYAIRRELYPPIPIGTLLDDVLIPMQIARRGHRVIFQPAAMAHDRIYLEKGKEFARKVRTLTGNYQLLRLAPWMLSAANPLLFRFVSHKLLRLLVPLLLVLMLVGLGRRSRLSLSHPVLVPNCLLCPRRPRHGESRLAPAQAGGPRQHIRDAQRRRSGGVLQFCCRQERSVGLTMQLGAVTWD